MATQTRNLHLVKPTYTERADIAIINQNMDIIDSAINANTTGKVDKPHGLASNKFLKTGPNDTLVWGDAVDQEDVAEQVESVVETWLAANMSNPDSPPLDRSLTQANAAAPADMVGDLKRTTESKTSSESYIPSMERGGLNGGTGAKEDSSTRIRTQDYIATGGIKSVSIRDGYSMAVLSYDAQKNFVSTTGWTTDTVTTFPSKYIKILARNLDNSNIYIDEKTNVPVVQITVSKDHERINNLESALAVSPVSANPEMEQGTISGIDGSESSSTTRIRTEDYIPVSGLVSVSIDDGFIFSIISYDSNYNFLTTTLFNYATRQAFYGDYIRIIVAYSSNATITPSVDTGLTVVQEASGTVIDEINSDIEISGVTVTPEMEQGTLDGSNGSLSSSTTRIRTAHYIPSEYLKYFTLDSTYSFTVIQYDASFAFISTSGWQANTAKWDTFGASTYIKVCVRKVDNSTITPDESIALALYYDKEQSINEVVEENRKHLNEIDATVLNTDRVSINILKYIYSPDVMSSGCVFVGDELWCFTAGEDGGGTTGSVYVLDYDFVTNTLTHNRTMTHNLGHVNSVAYCAETDSLICGNGSGSYTLSGEILILENLSNRGNTLNRSDCIVIDVGMDFGFKVNAVWGESNMDRHDIVYLCTNDSHSIYRLQLGKGINDLGSGTIISGATGFNGTYKVTHSWSWGQIGQDYANCVQGMTFWKNRLVWGYGHSKGLSMRMASLYADGKIVLDGANYEHLDQTGALLSRYICGMTKFGDNDEYLGICAGQFLFVVKDW